MTKPHQLAGRVPLIQATYVLGETLPFKLGRNDFQVLLSPHQFSLEKPEEPNLGRTDSRMKPSPCVCNESASGARRQIFKTIGSAGSLIWFNPRHLPEGCIASIVRSWLATTSVSDNIGLGLMIPKEKASEMKGEIEFWEATSEGSVVRQGANQLTPVWYVSLSVQNAMLNQLAAGLKPIETFPLVEFPEAIIAESWASHSEILAELKVRTEDLIYLDSSHPEAAFVSISKSLEVIPRGGAFPKTPVITPDGTSRTYLIALVSGAIHDTIFESPPNRIPFPHESGIEGYLLLRRMV
jgi:hypothetical protein